MMVALMLQSSGQTTPLSPASTGAAPLKRAHSHNDYKRTHPLQDALDHGFTSVEADVFLLDGQLRVGHTLEEARTGKTLEDLYLEPLETTIQANGGKVYADGTPLTLLVDIKTQGSDTYKALRGNLAEYAHIVTEYEDGVVQSDPVRVLLSGDVPRAEVEAETHRYTAIDGRLIDLGNGSADDLVPMVSASWQEHFLWHGAVPMPASEREKLVKMVAQAHEQGKAIRFWGTPDRTDVWKEELKAGVDVLNADNLPKLEEFLRQNDR